MEPPVKKIPKYDPNEQKQNVEKKPVVTEPANNKIPNNIHIYEENIPVPMDVDLTAFKKLINLAAEPEEEVHEQTNT